MDIAGGKGIMLGEGNFLARGYQGAPIAITVEGANILTRSMMIFGQGAIRCHPYVLEEMAAAQNNDVDAFDKLLFKHIGHVGSNKVRSFWLGLTRGLTSDADPRCNQTLLSASEPSERQPGPAVRRLHGGTGRQPEASRISLPVWAMC
jgi:alkylation response protein AidB-like acyl-CoA dehydrogenase